MSSKICIPIALATTSLFALALSGCSKSTSWFGGGEKQVVLASLESPASSPPSSHLQSPATQAARIVEPAVVTVHTQGRPVTVQTGPFSDPFFQQFFGGGGDVQQYVPRGAGSGVIISSDGYIVTNDHVVANAVDVTVNLNSQAYTAHVIGTDPVSDIAVVKINPNGAKLPVAQLGDSSSLRVGDYVIAVGNPLDVGTTVTLGIVSALNRKGLVADGRALAGTIQTDAAINPGNSGGALANVDGQVIGINEAIASPTGSSIGLGFAIPINMVRKVAAQLIATGHVVRPYLGVYFAALDSVPAGERNSIGIPEHEDTGALVVRVMPRSPAAGAGLQPHDVIVKANGQTVAGTTKLDDIVAELHVGDVLKLSVLRHGHPMDIAVRLRQRPTSLGTLANRPHTSSRAPRL